MKEAGSDLDIAQKQQLREKEGNNMTNQETIMVKKDLTNGNIHESTRGHLDVASDPTDEDRTTTKKWARILHLI